MDTKYFNFTDVIAYGWQIMKVNLWFFVGLGFIWLLIAYAPTISQIISTHMQLPETTHLVLFWTFYILVWVINIILGIGMIKIALSFCNQRKPSIGTLFNFRGCFWRYTATAILYGLIVLAGFVLLIVPGIIWAIKFGFSFYFVVDKGLGPIKALKASSRTTKGLKWELLGFGILTIMIIYVGILCLLVGVFAAYPIVLIAKTLVYRQLSAQTPELAGLIPAKPGTEPEPVSIRDWGVS